MSGQTLKLMFCFFYTFTLHWTLECFLGGGDGFIRNREMSDTFYQIKIIKKKEGKKVAAGDIRVPPPHCYCYHSGDRQNTATQYGHESGGHRLTTGLQHLYPWQKLCSSSLPQHNSLTQERELTPAKQLFQYPLACMFPIRKNCLYRGKKAHMANPDTREECSNVERVVIVTVRNSHFFPLPAFLFLLQTDVLSQS